MEILRSGDCLGAGTSLEEAPDRYHLLFDIREQSWGESPVLKGYRMVQMGATAEQSMDGIFPPGPDRHVDATMIELKWGKSCKMPVLQGKTMLWNIHNEDGNCEIDQFSHVYPLANRGGSTIRLLELFSGGYGGWSYGARFLRQHFNVPFQIIAVDCHWAANVNFATIHGAVLIDGTSDDLHHEMFDDMRDYVITANVTDLKWQSVVAAWRPDLATVSSPCQKWSKGGHACGLFSESGRLMAEAGLILRKMRPKVSLFEQVPGFMTHEHSKHILAQIKASGYHVVFAKVINSKQFGSAHRPRWLCMALLQHEPGIKPEQFEAWTANCTMSPIDMGSVVAWPRDFLEALRVPKEAIDMAMKAKFLPKEQRTPYMQDGKHLLRTRCFSGHELHPVIMARYGYQHEISEDFLENKGYFAAFSRTETN
eukprot:Skav204863  [mRNA]  locus=scaffold2222:106234:107505:+ [translate_table: standard]